MSCVCLLIAFRECSVLALVRTRADPQDPPARPPARGPQPPKRPPPAKEAPLPKAFPQRLGPARPRSGQSRFLFRSVVRPCALHGCACIVVFTFANATCPHACTLDVRVDTGERRAALMSTSAQASLVVLSVIYVCVCAHCVWAAFRLACLVVQPAMFRRRLLTQPEPEPSSAAAAAASAAEVAALRGEVSALRAEVSALRASVAQHALVHEHLHSTQCLGQTIAHIDRCVSMCGCAGVWVCGWVRC